MKDLEIQAAIEEEAKRQLYNIELIASENYVSDEVMEAAGSILTNKYAEGYPSKRYYGGCVNVDVVENIARERLCRIFGAEHANVQPHSGSQANMGVYMAVLEPGDKVLGMDLSSGGHLTHGHPLNFSGTLYHFVSYGVNRETEMIDYDEVMEIAMREKPKLIVAGASAYPRIIDFAKFREIADACGAYLMVDMAHIAGLVAAGLHPNPVPYCDFVTSTTHKTLRGPRGGIILCKEKYAALLDKKVFPGMQGGPLKVLSDTLKEEGFRIVTGGTDNHLILVDVMGSIGVSGKECEKILDEVCITCNKNTIPFDTQKPFVTSGIRLGTAAMTTRGFKEAEFKQVALWISKALKNKENAEELAKIRDEVRSLTVNYPIHRAY